MPLLRPTLCAALFASLLLAGCKDRQITAYHAPKDPAQAAAPAAPTEQGMPGLPANHPPIGGSTPAPGGDMASTPVPTGSDSLAWTAPAGWTAKPNGPMRKGSFSLKGENGAEADLSITSFPGSTGGMGANLNRWRAQVSLAPLPDDQLEAAIEHLDVNGLHLELVDFAGTGGNGPTRIVGAILSRPGETWFFKLMGPDALVAAQKDSFRDFLRTVKPRQP